MSDTYVYCFNYGLNGCCNGYTAEPKGKKEKIFCIDFGVPDSTSNANKKFCSFFK